MREPSDVVASEPHAAASGQPALITWTEDRSPGGVFVSTLAGPVVRLDAQGRDSAVAFDGSAFLVAWKQGGSGANVRGQRFSASGAPIDPTPFVIADNVNDLQVTSDGMQCVVAWGPSYSGPVKAVRVAPSGTVADDEGDEAEAAAAGLGDAAPAHLQDGRAAVSVWG